jgi:hypothetical protein
LDRPDWDAPEDYISCGIWGYNLHGERFAEEDYLARVQLSHQKINRYLAEQKFRKKLVLALNSQEYLAV